jgi:steroid delta-isomerase-like uncharacterized protein
MDYAVAMRRAYERINAADVDGFGELVADDFVDHEETPGLPPTKEGTLQFMRLLLSAFPDMRMDVEDLLASGDKTVARVRARGTHKGDFMGVAPTGKVVNVELIDIMRFNDAGLVCEHWGLTDMLSLLEQIGALPAPSPA